MKVKFTDFVRYSNREYQEGDIEDFSAEVASYFITSKVAVKYKAEKVGEVKEDKDNKRR